MIEQSWSVWINVKMSMSAGPTTVRTALRWRILWWARKLKLMWLWQPSLKEKEEVERMCKQQNNSIECSILIHFAASIRVTCRLWTQIPRDRKACSNNWPHNSPVSNLFLVSYTKSSAVLSSSVSSGCQKSMMTTYLSSADVLSVCVRMIDGQ